MADSGMMPVLEFRSQMRGAAARVWVFRDRIEWDRHGPGILSRGIAAAATENPSIDSSVFADGDVGSAPIDAISSVTAQRVGMHVRLSVVTRERTIEMDVSHAKAAKVQAVLRELMHPAPPADR